MNPKDIHALIAAADEDTIVAVAQGVLTQLDAGADIRVVHSLDAARRSIEEESFDVVLAQRSIDGQPAWLLAGCADAHHRPPLVLVGSGWGVEAVIEAMRHGAADVLDLPLGSDDLAQCICKVVRNHRSRNRVLLRNRRLRTLSSRLVRDRRELRRRVDLICRDLVQAYRQLAEKVVSRHHAPADTDYRVPNKLD